MSIFTDLWGAGQQLTPLQMSCRAFVMFFIALLLIRIAGMRTFGRKSAFDIIVGVMLGALLVRGVIGASPFFSVVAAGFVMVILHRLIASIAVSHEWIGKIVKGENRVLYKSGAIQWKEMRKSGVSEKDLMESVRIEANVTSLDEIEEARMERDGEISVGEKDVCIRFWICTRGFSRGRYIIVSFCVLPMTLRPPPITSWRSPTGRATFSFKTHGIGLRQGER